MTMKNLKKLAALVLALMMILSLAAVASAADGKGSVTINGVGEETKYAIYQLLDLESYNVADGAYSYKVNSAWEAYFQTAEAKTYFSIEEGTGYVSWIAGDDAAAVAEFAKKALAYAQANGIDPLKSSVNDGEFVITEEEGKLKGVFSDLPLGYYLVDSSMGALCGLTTTNPDAYITAKNGEPSIQKQVKEDGTGGFGPSNSADIGQIVEFLTTITVHDGAQNYVLHDKMSAGLTFQAVTAVEYIDASEGKTDRETVSVDNYTVVESRTELEDDCTFEVRFKDEFCATLNTNDKLLVTYTAMLNRNAVIAGAGNANETKLSYGDSHNTTTSQTTTYTFAIDIVKTDSQNKLINGAKFRIYDAATGGNEVAVVLMDDGVTYRRARADETGIEIEVKEGKVRVVGFDNGTYYLEETQAPDGYNKLTARQRFIISDGNLDSIFNDGIYSTGSGVHVVNKTGSMLPETGGVGTTLFYIIGGVLVVGAVVLLVAKKRMKSMD